MIVAFLRAHVRERLAALIAAQVENIVDGVQVASGWPGENVRADGIWIVGTTGRVDHKVFAGTTLPTDDRFTITVLCMAALDGRSRTEADELGASFASAVMRAVHDTTLDDLEVNNSFVISVVLGDVDDYTTGTDTGFASFWTVSVDVHTRTSYSGADA